MLPRESVAATPRVTCPACPRHPLVSLDGGPVLFWCADGHNVPAADLDNEFRPAVAAVAA